MLSRAEEERLDRLWDMQEEMTDVGFAMNDRAVKRLASDLLWAIKKIMELSEEKGEPVDHSE